MRQVTATAVAKGRRIPGLYRPHGRSIKFSQTIRLKCPDIAGEAKPGQFVMVNCGPGCVLPRPFSIHRVINEEYLDLYFAVLERGKGSDWLSQRKMGDKIEVLGPLGNGFSVQPASKRLLLVAGGMGIAPLCFLADKSIEQGKEVTLLMGASSAVHLLPAESSGRGRLTGEIFPKGIKIEKVTDDESGDYRGVVTDVIAHHIDSADQVFACGPLPMYKTMAQMPELKNKPVQVSLEVRMGCGRGVCYGCTIKTKNGLKMVCEDGPVFDLKDIDWDGLTPV